jgi:hypothetical protein
MRIYLIFATSLWLAPASNVVAQYESGAPGAPPTANRFDARRTRERSRSRRRNSGRRATTQPANFEELRRQGETIADKIKQLGPWEERAQQIERAINEYQIKEGITEEPLLALKDLAIAVGKHPPWDLNARLETAIQMIGDRYGLDDGGRRGFRRWAIGQGAKLFMKYGSRVFPVAQEVLDARLSGKPFTPEQVAKWSKAIRPLVEEAYAETMESLQSQIRTLPPDKQRAINADLAVVDRRHKINMHKIKTEFETGKWKPGPFALTLNRAQGDTGAVEAETSGRNRFKGRPNADRGGLPVASAAPGPPRLGDTRNHSTVIVSRQAQASPLPDESAWVAYVNSFCARYNLDKAQKQTAHSILKDLQEQARTYRGSHSEEISSLTQQLQSAESAEEKRGIQAELRQVLAGVDELFKELKARLENIPTSDQMRRGG